MPERNVVRPSRVVAADPDDLARVPENTGALAVGMIAGWLGAVADA